MGAGRRMLEVIGVAFDRGFVRRWLVATVEEDDPRVQRWDALSAEVAV
jgi:hypothetical protein